MSYIGPNTATRASLWNNLFSQAETILTSALGGASAVILGFDTQWDRGFFMGFDPQTPTGLHPVAIAFINNYLANRGGSGGSEQGAVLCWREYNHSAITSLVSGLSQVSNTSTYQVVQLAIPTWTTWAASIYPSSYPNYQSYLSHTISGTLYPYANCLDVCLSVLTQNVGGTPYNVTFNCVLDAEHAQPYKPIDVFFTGNLTWSS